MSTQIEDLEEAEDIAVPLIFKGDGNSRFNFRNAPGLLQRGNILQYQSNRLLGLAKLYAVVHGSLSTGEAATLIVLEFRFLCSEVDARRFKSAHVSTTFYGKKRSDSTDPVVVSVVPDGYHKIAQTTYSESMSRSTTRGISDHGSPAPSSFSLGISESRETHGLRVSYASIEGFSCHSKERTGGSENQAKWALYENNYTKEGIKSAVFTAVLLKHQTKDAFTMHADFEVGVGAKSVKDTITRMFFGGSRHRVDPVAFAEEGKRTDFRRKAPYKGNSALDEAIDLLDRSALEISPAFLKVIEEDQWNS